MATDTSTAPILILTQGHAGDRLGARLVPELRRRFPRREVLGLGGSGMEAQGVRLLARADDLSAMGYSGLLPKLPSILAAVYRTGRGTRSPVPACLIAVDVWQPLRFVHRMGPHLRRIPHVCYLPPAPNLVGPSRVHTAVSRAFGAIVTPFPHQARLYAEAGGRVYPAAHAGLQACREETVPLPVEGREPVLAILPGSRVLEIRHSLPVQAAAAREILARHPELRPVVCCASDAVARRVKRLFPGMECARGAREVLARARFALICSGTAALEAAVLGCPGVVTYHGSRLQRWEFRRFHAPGLARLRAEGIASPFIALPNILSGEELYPELLDVPAPAVAEAALRELSGDPAARRAQLDRVAELLAWEDAGEVVARAVGDLL